MATVAEEQRFILTGLSPSRAQRRLALAVAIALILASLIALGPLSNLQSPRIDAFVPAYSTAIFLTELITAVLLFAQFSIVRSRAVAVLASGYLFAALIMIPWMLTFPGAVAPGGLLGAGPYSTQWLYSLRQIAFPIFIIAYALLKDAAEPSRRLWQGSVAAGIVSSVALTAALLCAATLLVTVGHALLPNALFGPDHSSTIRTYNFGFQIGLGVAALIVLWLRLRSVLDLWLVVMMCAYFIGMLWVMFFSSGRFSIGWYTSAAVTLVSGSLLLFVLLYEITALYGQLLRATLAQRREREARLMTGDAVAAAIAHEINQPLGAMVTNADAALHWLDQSMPDIDRAKKALTRIGGNGRRAAAVIASIRAMFKSNIRNRNLLDINELISETMDMLGSDLQRHRIAVQNDLCSLLPQVIGDRIQLQQVLLNLINNAIESMTSEGTYRVVSIKSKIQDDGDVVISVADSGKGVASHDVDRIFNPLFTTKSEGMGMGLSICRSIIEAHGGGLSVADNTPRGTIFRFNLPVSAP